MVYNMYGEESGSSPMAGSHDSRSRYRLSSSTSATSRRCEQQQQQQRQPTSNAEIGPGATSHQNIDYPQQYYASQPVSVSSQTCIASSTSTLYIGRLKRCVSINRMAEKRVKKVRIYRNGDRYFCGMIYVVSTDRHRTFESLLADLTASVICDRYALPTGVRFLFAADTGRRVLSIDQLINGASYVCSSSCTFRRLDYTRISLQSPTRIGLYHQSNIPSAGRSRSRSPHQGVFPHTTNSTGSGNWGINPGDPESAFDAAEIDLSFVRPRLVHVLRNSCRPRHAVRFILNKRTAQTFEQVLSDISQAIRLDSGAVKRIYTIDGVPVLTLKDFFGDDDIFVAYGSERHYAEDFMLSEKEAQNLSLSNGNYAVVKKHSFANHRSDYPMTSSDNIALAETEVHKVQCHLSSTSCSPRQTSTPSDISPSVHCLVPSTSSQHHVATKSPSLSPVLLSNTTTSFSPRCPKTSPETVCSIRPSTSSKSDCVSSKSMSRTSSTVSPPASTATDFTGRSMSIKTMSSPPITPRIADVTGDANKSRVQISHHYGSGPEMLELNNLRPWLSSEYSQRPASGVNEDIDSAGTIINPGPAEGDQHIEPLSLRVKYKIGKVIGEGNFAIVKECVEKARKRKFALKIIDKSKCKGKEHKIDNEVLILRRLRHPNIIQLVEDYDTPVCLYMVMELVMGGDLFESISAATNYTERDASGMMYHICNAVHYLHSLNIVHRDIKPENLLVHEKHDGTKSLKLGDFGLAAYVTKPLRTVCGTLTYVAPEVLAQIGYGLKVDVWSVGVIAYILLCGFPPFVSKTNNREELMKRIIKGKFEFVAPCWNNISMPAKDLIRHMIEVDVNKRFSASQLMEHPWVAEDSATLDNVLHSQIGTRVVALAHRNREIVKKSTRVRQSAIDVLATTALDKGFLWFPDSCSQQLPPSSCRRE